jgi:hypothetical protein
LEDSPRTAGPVDTAPSGELSGKVDHGSTNRLQPSGLKLESFVFAERNGLGVGPKTAGYQLGGMERGLPPKYERFMLRTQCTNLVT